jgi:hypothetical protein
MTPGSDTSSETVDVLRAAWAASGSDQAVIDETSGPKKVCRNARSFSFDGYAEPGTDLRSAWQERLRREGKLSTSGASVRDLVLGPRDSD